jgi:hypothetical protein
MTVPSESQPVIDELRAALKRDARSLANAPIGVAETALLYAVLVRLATVLDVDVTSIVPLDGYGGHA